MERRKDGGIEHGNGVGVPLLCSCMCGNFELLFLEKKKESVKPICVAKKKCKALHFDVVFGYNLG